MSHRVSSIQSFFSPTTPLVSSQQFSALFQLLAGKTAKLPALPFLMITPRCGAGFSISLIAIWLLSKAMKVTLAMMVCFLMVLCLVAFNTGELGPSHCLITDLAGSGASQCWFGRRVQLQSEQFSSTSFLRGVLEQLGLFWPSMNVKLFCYPALWTSV